MSPAIQRFFAFIAIWAIGIKEWVCPANVFRLVLGVLGILFCWAAAKLFMYEGLYAVSNIRDFMAIGATLFGVVLIAIAFPSGWVRARRVFGF